MKTKPKSKLTTKKQNKSQIKSKTKINKKQIVSNKTKKIKKVKKQALTLESPIIKKLQKKHKHDKLYKIIWNGGRPLTTYISKDNNIYVYTMNYGKYKIKGANTSNTSYNSNNTYEFLFESSGYKYHTENVFNLKKNKVNKIFIADSLLLDHTLKNNNERLVHKFYSRYFKKNLSYDTDNKKWQGNATLININNKSNNSNNKLEYIAILGYPGIVKFKLDKGEEITEFYSLIGPGASPYTIAYSKNYLYVFSEGKKVKLSNDDRKLSLGSKINGWSDIYSYYNEQKKESKRISNINFKLLYKPVI
jgi:hypothetical protein